MISICAVTKDLGPSQKNFYLIKSFNKLSKAVEISTSVFYERPSIPVVRPLFSCMGISFVSSYGGNAISTTLEEADKLLKSNTSCKKFLYLWDLEWLESPVFFTKAYEILSNERLNIIARSESHAEVIENFCNKSVVGIVDDWNTEQLLSILQEKEGE